MHRSGLCPSGGETAILPDFYKEGEYDLAGFCVGVVERKHILNGSEIRLGDKVIGLASSGLHSNGYSLARKIVFEHAGSGGGCVRAGAGPDGRRRAARAHPALRAGRQDGLPAVTASSGSCTGSPTSPAADWSRTCHASCPTGMRIMLRRGSWTVPKVFPWLPVAGLG